MDDISYWKSLSLYKQHHAFQDQFEWELDGQKMASTLNKRIITEKGGQYNGRYYLYGNIASVISPLARLRKMRCVNLIINSTIPALQAILQRTSGKCRYYLIGVRCRPNGIHAIAMVVNHQTTLCSDLYRQHYFYDPNEGMVFETQNSNFERQFFRSKFFMQNYQGIDDCYEVVPLKQSLGL